MKLKNILAGLCFVALFYFVVNIIAKSNKGYYEFQNYKKTIDSPISGLATRIIEGKHFFGAQIGADSNNYFRFTYQVERTPKLWIRGYPDDFIVVGDSITKEANSDTFVVKRGKTEWTYLLPKDSKTQR
ncbi:MAG TPA: hypothetical protein VFU29_07145 [Chitinophagaceae bacterium]|nr:hypothetical protein [Chitinophagaceae bacterium]